MAVRDISPSSWDAPGQTRLTPGLVMTNLSDNSLPLDVVLSSFSPTLANTSFTLAAGVNQYPVPDRTNQRGVILYAPRNNAQSINVKWDPGDVGGYINPNGLYCTTFDPNNMPVTMYVTAGDDASGTAIYWW